MKAIKRINNAKKNKGREKTSNCPFPLIPSSPQSLLINRINERIDVMTNPVLNFKNPRGIIHTFLNKVYWLKLADKI